VAAIDQCVPGASTVALDTEVDCRFVSACRVRVSMHSLDAFFCSLPSMLLVGQAAGLPFIGVSAMTGVGCCVAFFTGLRTFRRLYSPVMPAVLPNNPANFHNDFTLSVAIGGMQCHVECFL
jgi:hypothetical protein